MSALIDYQKLLDRTAECGLRVTLMEEEPSSESDNPFRNSFMGCRRTEITIWKGRKKMFLTDSTSSARAFVAGYQAR